MLTIGLTGGIGCGKSTVSNLFKQLGVPIIDADKVAHEIVQPNKPALTCIKKTFGNKIISPDGSLDRNKLRNIIFKDENQRKKLEHILHPIIFKTMLEELKSIDSHYGILSIPLLFETNQQHKMDRVLVIDCPELMQKARITARDSLDEGMIDSIIKSQSTRDYKTTHADDILINDSSLESLQQQVQQLHQRYLKMSTGNK